MFAYVVRRVAYGGVVVIGVLFFLFILFFAVTAPDDIARKALGDRVPPAAIEQWKINHGYDKPLWPWQDLRENLLFDHFRRMLTFDFGRSDADDVPIAQRVRGASSTRMELVVKSAGWPSSQGERPSRKCGCLGCSDWPGAREIKAASMASMSTPKRKIGAIRAR